MPDQKTEQRFNELKQKYASVLNTIEQKGVRLANLHVENNKLFIKGTAPSQAVKNQIWDQIKLVDPSFSDVTADIEAPAQTAETGSPATSAGANAGGQMYTVQSGDTLSEIAKRFYGDANQYMMIFNANRDKLKDPNMIQPGQQLSIPPR